ncbi:type III pantothenate kinase [Flagellatimonas centrodinii]|uniref:type III pantothenate kinase n=1 Tax=Flagellatimonas centrodinii TaxID=2806210 RepID=UPI001FED87F9|nr:type III pantothenate kinase [Flagellatimonas centrodinii]ULQ45255.1 type III pantothenate kinase [Flagellatimonas centrodinii]
MILLLDIGNTRLKWGRVGADGVQYGGALPHGGDFQALVEQLPVTRPDAVWVSHVLGEAHEPALVAGLTRRYGVDPQLARTRGVSPGLRIAYTDPARLGVDRWLGMLAVRQRTEGAFVVASAGTALTLDVVDDTGNHLGGFIAPGLQTALSATLGATRFETGTRTNAFRANLGRDTDACVREGAVLSCLGALDRGLTLAPATASRWMTGGDAPLLLPHLGHWAHRPHLTLEGLRVLALEE